MSVGSRLFFLALFGTSVVCNAGAQAGARTIARRDLPKALQVELDKGQLKRVAPGVINSVDSNANQVVIRPGEILAATTGTAPVFRTTKPALSGAGGRNPASVPDPNVPSTSGTSSPNVSPSGSLPRPLPPSSTTTPTGPTTAPITGPVDSVFALPFSYIGFDRNGATPAYQPTFTPRGGLRYAAALKRFEGNFAVGLELTDTPGEVRELARPVSMSFGGDADSIFPASVEFVRAGGPDVTVFVYTGTPIDSLRVLVIPKFDPNHPVSVWLAVRPTLTIETPPREIQGFGTESRTIKIGTRGIFRADSINVSISSDRGSLSADELYVRRSGATVRLRSGGGLGPTIISANAPGFAPAEATINFTFPFLFVGAALFGGAMGALWAELRQRRRGTHAVAARRVAGAVIGAVLATVVYAGIGVNLLLVGVDVPLVNEIGVFAFSALGGMMGLMKFSKSAVKS